MSPAINGHCQLIYRIKTVICVIVYDFRAQLQGTGSRSEVSCEKFE